MKNERTVSGLTIEEYQYAFSIETNKRQSEEEKRVDLVQYFNPSKDVKKVPLSQLNLLYKELKEDIEVTKGAKPPKHIKVGGSHYVVDYIFDGLTAGQLIDIMSLDLQTSVSVCTNMHKVMAALTRKCSIMKFLPEKYNAEQFQSRAELMLKECKMREVFGVTGFFLSISSRFWESIQTYLDKTTNRMTEDLNRERRKLETEMSKLTTKKKVGGGLS